MTYTPTRAGETIDVVALEDMVGVWADYTPVWTASTTAPSIGSGSLTGRAVIIGSTVHYTIKLTGAADTVWGAGSYTFSLPTPASGSADFAGDVFIGDSSGGSAAYSTGVAIILAGGSTVSAYVGASNSASAVRNGTPQTFASGDRIWISGTYELA